MSNTYSEKRKSFSQIIEEQTLKMGDKVKFVVGGVTNKVGVLVGLSTTMGKIYTPKKEKSDENNDVSPETSEWFTLYLNKYGNNHEPAGIISLEEEKINKIDFNDAIKN